MKLVDLPVRKRYVHMRRIVLAFIWGACLVPGSAVAQDPAFSQFFASPLSLNPALTGKFNGSLRVAGNYRNQWPQINNAFITSTASIDGNILGSRLPAGDAWGIGALAMTDKTANGILTSNYFSVSTAYQKALDENGWNQLGMVQPPCWSSSSSKCSLEPSSILFA